MSIIATLESFINDVEKHTGIQKIRVIRKMYNYVSTPDVMLYLNTRSNLKNVFIETCVRVKRDLKEVYPVENSSVIKTRMACDRFLKTIDGPPPPQPLRRSKRIQERRMMESSV